MITPTCLIEVNPADGSIIQPFDFMHNVSINSSWENLIDTCTLVLPKKVKVRKTGRYLDPITSGNNVIFRRGDGITVNLGYDGNLTRRFQGVISHVNPKVPVQLLCEDDGFRLKQSICPKYFQESGTLSNILKTILPIDVRTGKQYVFHCDDIRLGKFTIEKCSVMELLDYLKKHFGFSIYFRDNILFVGLAYTQQKIADFSNPDTPLNVFHFQKNIISTNNLEFFREEDIKYKVTSVSWQPDNSKKIFNFGDVDGELRTLNFYGLSDADVKKLSIDWLGRFKYTGFRGSFTAFLDPIVQHGDAIVLRDAIIPDRNGTYLVKKVVTESGVNGGRQTITLDRILI